MRRWLLLGSALLIASAGVGGNAWAAGSPAAPQRRGRQGSPHGAATSHVRSRGRKQVIRLDRRTSAQPRAAWGRASPQNSAAASGHRREDQRHVHRVQRAGTGGVPGRREHLADPDPQHRADRRRRRLVEPHRAVQGPQRPRRCRPDRLRREFHGAPGQNVYYPMALANAIAGSDLCPPTSATAGPTSDFAIRAAPRSRRRSTAPSRPGTTAPTGIRAAGQVDLESVVLHELGHGLGFVGTFDVPESDRPTGNGVLRPRRRRTLTPRSSTRSSRDGLGNRPADSYQRDRSRQLGDALRGKDGGLSWDRGGRRRRRRRIARAVCARSRTRRAAVSRISTRRTYPAGRRQRADDARPRISARSSIPSVRSCSECSRTWIGRRPALRRHPRRRLSRCSTDAAGQPARDDELHAARQIPIAASTALPAYVDIKAVVVDVTVQSPTRTGIWHDAAAAAPATAVHFRPARTSRPAGPERCRPSCRWTRRRDHSGLD